MFKNFCLASPEAFGCERDEDLAKTCFAKFDISFTCNHDKREDA